MFGTSILVVVVSVWFALGTVWKATDAYENRIRRLEEELKKWRDASDHTLKI